MAHARHARHSMAQHNPARHSMARQDNGKTNPGVIPMVCEQIFKTLT